jgi:putative NADH-flavin reductase
MSKALRIAVLGPKGQCGQCVVDELLSRGYSVVGISRTPPETWPKTGDYSSIAVDFSDTKTFSSILSEGDFNAVVSAFAPPLQDLKDVYRLGVEGHGNIKMAILKSSYRGPFIIIGQYFASTVDFGCNRF